jgi:UDPglucose 6-dehydrogenase
MDVAVIGTGHVGLVTCASLASIGHQVAGLDSDTGKIDALRRGIMPFSEPGLGSLVERVVTAGALTFAHDLAEWVPDADVVFLCVGTPPRASGEANLVAVESAARAIAPHASDDTVLVEKSTVPAGTARRLRQLLCQHTPGRRLEVASNPEFLREGKAVQDAMSPDRILVGAESAWAFDVMRRLYRPLIDGGARLIETDIATAELAKHACNAFLALKISYINAIARVCERAGADVVSVAEVMGADSRIGPAFLAAGLGYGGSCFPKDLLAFERLASRLGYDFRLLGEISRINEEAVQAVADRVREALWNLEGKTVALLGLSFKPGTDDVRFAPALRLAHLLAAGGARVVGYDPLAGAAAHEEVPDLWVVADPYDALDGADCAVYCTEWDEFRELDLRRVRRIMALPVIVDARNMLDPDRVSAAGLAYYPVGRSAVEPDWAVLGTVNGAEPMPLPT